MAKVAVISTVFNEYLTINDLVKSLQNQTLSPSEVVIVDAGSTDGTWELLKTWSKTWPILKVFQHPSNRSAGRNFAIFHTKSDLIAITDAGCHPRPNWMENLIAPFSSASTQVVSGYYQAVPQSAFEACLATYVLVMPNRIPHEFWPSTRSMALKKSAWTKVNGFNEALNTSEDYEFASRLKRAGYGFVFAKSAIVEWRPRPTLRSAVTMFFTFAVSDVQAGLLRGKAKFIIARYLAASYLFFLSFDWAALRPVMLMLVVIYICWSILKNITYTRHLKSLFWLPVLQISSDLAVILGTVVGWLLVHSAIKVKS